MHVYYPKPAHAEVAQQLQVLACEGVRVSTKLAEVPDYEVLIEGRPTRELLAESSKLRYVVVPFAGVPEPTIALVQDFPRVQIHNLHHNAADTAELALALLMACSKRIVPMDQKMRKGDWSPRYEVSKSIILRDKTVLVLGYGHIGKQIARSCKGLGMKVLAIRRSAKEIEIDGIAEVHPLVGLGGLLPEADVLIVALPRTKETTGLLGSRELNLLPAGAILVNIARADIVDEEALYLALRGEKLHSAGLDVWYLYPEGGVKGVPGYFHMPESATHTWPSHFPVQDLENVVMSPHRGGVSIDTEERRVAALAEIINAAAQGGHVPYRVDLEAGY